MTLGVCFRLRDWLWCGLRPVLRRSTRPIPVIPTRSGLVPMVSSVGLEPLEPRLLLSASPTDIQPGQEITTTEPAAIVVLEPGPLPNLDIDLNGRLDALTDGVMVLRHMLGFSGTAVTSGAADPGGRRTDPLDISAYLTSIHSSLDIDLNGQVDALSDGMLIIRYAFGFEGHDLIEPMVLNGQRTDSAAIAQYLDSMNPEQETMVPLVVAALQQDTGASNSDGITFNATVAGTIMDINAIATFRAGFDATTPAGFLDVLSDLRSGGVCVLSQATAAGSQSSPIVDISSIYLSTDPMRMMTRSCASKSTGFSRMLKMSASFVLASLRGSTCGTEYDSLLRSLRPRLWRGVLGTPGLVGEIVGHFEHPLWLCRSVSHSGLAMA